MVSYSETAIGSGLEVRAVVELVGITRFDCNRGYVVQLKQLPAGSMEIVRIEDTAPLQ